MKSWKVIDGVRTPVSIIKSECTYELESVEECFCVFNIFSTYLCNSMTFLKEKGRRKIEKIKDINLLSLNVVKIMISYRSRNCCCELILEWVRVQLT